LGLSGISLALYSKVYEIVEKEYFEILKKIPIFNLSQSDIYEKLILLYLRDL